MSHSVAGDERIWNYHAGGLFFALPSHKIDEPFRARGRTFNVGERAHCIRDTVLGSTFVFEGLLIAE